METLLSISLAKSTYYFQEQTKLLTAHHHLPPLWKRQASILSLQLAMTEILID